MFAALAAVAGASDGYGRGCGHVQVQFEPRLRLREQVTAMTAVAGVSDSHGRGCGGISLSSNVDKACGARTSHWWHTVRTWLGNCGRSCHVEKQ